MEKNKNGSFNLIFSLLIIALIGLFVYLAFFGLPNSKISENKIISVVTDTVDYNDYLFQQKLAELYSDIADKQQNQYTWLLVFFIGVVITMIIIFISTINRIFNYQIEYKIKEVEEKYRKKLLDSLNNEESDDNALE